MVKPGEFIPADGPILCNAGRDVTALLVENTSEHSIYVTSHYHFFEANKRLRFDRRAAYGTRLDIPAGSGVGWKPGEVKEVPLVPISGRRNAYGFHGLVNGPLTDEQREMALEQARRAGFLDSEV